MKEIKIGFLKIRLTITRGDIFLLISFSLVLISILIGTGSLFNLSIFKNERSGIVNCVDDKDLYNKAKSAGGGDDFVIYPPSTIFGRTIPCEKNSDCSRDKIENYCSPNEVSSFGMPFCGPTIKCSHDKICEYYCR